ncbi:hypothetical protein K458DRAFT_390445 [Lentithecium fluviatile CBS 122367]|uniref:Uncharacterized protein n=1 Tax=Lentithecium fluviatile CBS 122367 TaxID=1168545 RepID=A0A6G1IY52_9PLEO|nr:hypothetical protein K458DRAFT_390445 [Lentithecium fluviatile CBS 122367]
MAWDTCGYGFSGVLPKLNRVPFRANTLLKKPAFSTSMLLILPSPNESDIPHNQAADMRSTFISILTVIGLALAVAVPDLPMTGNDEFDSCDNLGDICNGQDNQVCDPDTHTLQICHRFSDGNCWIHDYYNGC